MSLTTEAIEPLNSIGIRRGRKGVLRSQKWRWVFYAANGRTLAQSSEGYANLGDLLDALVQILGVSRDTLIDQTSWDNDRISAARLDRPDTRPTLVVIR